MKLKSLWLLVILTFVIVGCDYILTEPTSTCDPPNKLVKDIYGNEVCVTPEEGAEEVMPEEEMAEEETMEEETPEEEVTEEVPEEEVEEEAEEETETAAVPRKVVTEGDLVEFPNLQATDPDGEDIDYTFDDPLDEDGEWQTEVGDAGEYLTTITASDGTNEVSQDVLIVVLSANNPPVITGIDEELTVDEGDTISFDPVVTDEEGDDVTIAYSGWMDSAEYKTDFTDAGEYEVTITASDGTTQSEVSVAVVVNNVNRPPLLESLDDLQVEVGDTFELEVDAEDADGDDLTFEFSDPLDEDGTWTPEEGDEGDYEVIVTVSDGEDSDSEKFTLTVGTPNLPPVFDALEDISVDEGETVVIEPVAEDPEGEDVLFTVSGWMTSLTYQTTFEDAGTYIVTVSASDGVNDVSQTIEISVNDVNRPPRWDPGSFE